MAEQNSPMANSSRLRTARPVSQQMASGLNLTPKQIIAIFRRHLLLIFIVTTLSTCLAVAAFFVVRKYAPKYTARTYIEVLQPGVQDPTKIAQTPANKDVAYGFRVTKAALIKQESSFRKLLKRDKVQRTSWYISHEGASQYVDAIEDLKENVGASPQRESSYITVSMTCGNAKESALIVNELVDLFIKDQQARASLGANVKISRLTNQQQQIESDLRAISGTIEDIVSGSGVAGLVGRDEVRNSISVKLDRIVIEQVEVASDIKQLENAIENLEGRTAALDSSILRATSGDPAVIPLIRRINILEIDLASKLTKFGDKHREVQTLKELLKQAKLEKETTQALVAQQIRNSNLQSARDNLATLESRLEELEEDQKDSEEQRRRLDQDKLAYETQVQKRDERREALELVRQRIDSYNIMKTDTEAAKVISTGDAPMPLQMSSPNIIIYGFAGIFLGFILSAGLAFLVEILNDLMRTPSDVNRFLKMPLLASVCHADMDDEITGVDLWHVVRQAPHSMMSECYRHLRANIHQWGPAESNKVLFITSCGASDGRTTVAANIAAAFVAEDQKILIIDANFRRPTSLEMFPVAESNGTAEQKANKNQSMGLSNLLMGQCDSSEVLRQSGISGLDILDSGPLPPNPTELFSSTAMKQLMIQYGNEYDRIIIDGPPMLVSDAKALAVVADATILVLNAALTRRGAAQRITRELRQSNTNILGAVIIGVRMLKGGYFKEMFESYQDYQKVSIG